jgi:hypothetical protein
VTSGQTVIAMLVFMLAMLVVACTGEPVDAGLGARCGQADDCDSRCLTPSPDYPGGMCTQACGEVDGCPSGASCVAEEGGVCLFTCRDDADCEFLGAVDGLAWRCHERDAEAGEGVTFLVCRGEGLSE